MTDEEAAARNNNGPQLGYDTASLRCATKRDVLAACRLALKCESKK